MGLTSCGRNCGAACDPTGLEKSRLFELEKMGLDFFDSDSHDFFSLVLHLGYKSLP